MNTNRPEGFTGEIITSPLKAIKAKCMDCVCDDREEMVHCQVTDCALFPFRFGKNPYRDKRELSEEHKEKLVAALQAGRRKIVDTEEDE